MEILIAGAGKVGYYVAKSLSKKHNVTIIDKNEEALEKVKENLDVLTIKGDLREISTYKRVENFDYAIIVTNSDEINLLSALIIDSLQKSKNKIVRFSNTSYLSTTNYISDKLRIERVIFPYILSANAIAKLIEIPKANNIKHIPFTEFVLISALVKEPKIKNIAEIEKENLKVIGIERDEFFFSKDEELKEDDLIYLLGDIEEIKKALNLLDTISPNEIKNVLINSASPVGIHLAKILNDLNLNVKILEKDPSKAKSAAEMLEEEVIVINSSYDDEDILINEGIKYADIAISTALKDEQNIIKSLQARKLGIKKIISINNDLNYYSIMHSLKIPTIRGPKIAAYYEILEEIDSEFMIYERFFLGAKGRIFIKKVYENKTITPPKELNKTLIIREDKIFEVIDSFEVKEGDLILEFNFSGNRRWIEKV